MTKRTKLFLIGILFLIDLYGGSYVFKIMPNDSWMMFPTALTMMIVGAGCFVIGVHILLEKEENVPRKYAILPCGHDYENLNYDYTERKYWCIECEKELDQGL